MKNVFVVGSINMDFTVSVGRMPMIGETINGYGFITCQGGKGANQAVACKKLGCENVYMVGSVGNDSTGTTLLNELNNYGIDTSAVEVVEGASGSAVIVLDDEVHDNIIIIDHGANAKVSKEKAAEFLKKNAKPGDILICQLEINLDAIYEAFKVAKEIGMYTILNPAPVCDFDKECLKNVDLIAPNETETKLMTGVDPETPEAMLEAYKYFNQYGIKELIITLGSKGSAYINNGVLSMHKARKVVAVDTTSAGDTFLGALAYKKAIGEELIDSFDFAAACSSITVSRKGSGKSIPTIDEVMALLNK